MKVLIVGGGAREHALAWAFKRDNPAITLYAAPGNPGIAELATCLPIPTTEFDDLVRFARQERITLTVVGPEAPLAAGIVDHFRAEGLPIFGPTRQAAQIETSKAFAKQLMLDASVPTARALTCTDVARARGAARELGAPVVIKASGLAAGKGVIVCDTIEEADRAIDSMLVDRSFGIAGSELLVEEFMEGEEVSVFAITNGDWLVPMVPAQDHKRLLAGDHGPNTGGMGAYAPVTAMRGATQREVVDTILRPTLDALRAHHLPFTGLLYAGLMLTRDGPKVVEFNCRFGDPETQAILAVTSSDPTLLDVMLAAATDGEAPDEALLSQPSGHAVTTVIASAGYPDQPRTGEVIAMPPSTHGVLVFHAGTKRAPDGSLLTNGGRVLAITGHAATFEDAQRISRDFASRVEFEGKQFREDIGWRELARLTAAGHAGAA
ncbi:MAG TPA: phosphoribosylamine--glycine ligase [Gemmatimonadaceae bacterium]|nr:phosphoribosylamine--glycine ligase [Gemmatimonadaceae bacterium]